MKAPKNKKIFKPQSRGKYPVRNYTINDLKDFIRLDKKLLSSKKIGSKR